MATPTDPIWDRDPHTAKKHEIIRRYLQAWLPILLNTKLKAITYAEGFAGPGTYTNGEPGSPVIAYAEALRALAGRDGKKVMFALVEERADRLEILKDQLAKAGAVHPKAPLWPRKGTCAERLVPLLEEIGAFKTPIFALLDSWGGPVVPHAVLSRIAANPSSEVFVTFQPSYLARFGSVAQHRASGNAAFGSEEWQAVAGQPSHLKYAYLAEAYRASVKVSGFAHVLSFELLDEQGHELHLVFGTNSVRGIEKMKDSMWKIDPIQGLRYRDPRDLDQESFEIALEPGTGPLRRLLRAHIDTLAPRFTLEDLQQFTLLETVYRPPHATAVVRALIREGVLEKLTPGPVGAKTEFRVAPVKSPPPDRGHQPALF
jgi:three-Cys-motif partner protein